MSANPAFNIVPTVEGTTLATRKMLQHLGIPFSGNSFTVWPKSGEGSSDNGFNIFSIFPETSDYFAPSESRAMINFVVEDLYALIDILRAEGVTVPQDPITEPYGKFGWVLDPEGNKIELWEAPEKE